MSRRTRVDGIVMEHEVRPGRHRSQDFWRASRGGIRGVWHGRYSDAVEDLKVRERAADELDGLELMLREVLYA